MGVLLPQLYHYHPGLPPAPVPCLLSKSIPVPPAARAHSEAAFPILEAAFLYTIALPMLIWSLCWGSWRSPLRLPIDEHPCQAQSGNTPVSSLSSFSSYPSYDCSQEGLCAGVLTPVWCAHAQGLPASCMMQRGCGSRAGALGMQEQDPLGLHMPQLISLA